ncbi:DUF3331 domain-containing protein [Burkholderia pseudomallei]|uniref:DUF3331 domain-containing protein n=1 Tax=Burkholderia pseudomallei TaxID=28450 RepID=UPI00194032FD|nr:DUF3331 domain-containing protein [Burkholderia pseudomallei]MBM5584959.1 DUF3331 domain-containing protein [Burkholderia pseudomallei]
MNRIDPWLQIISRLDCCTHFTAQFGQKTDLCWARERCKSLTYVVAKSSPIRRIEWLSSRKILVSWSDPTIGRYEGQAWNACFARDAGFCCLTGTPVLPGDLVFRPFRRGRITPANALYMILASTLPRSKMVDEV